MDRAELQRLVIEEARRQGVDPREIMPLVNTESRWNPGAVSPKGAAGLMQIMPATGADLGVSNAFDLLDPKTNVAAGVRYYKQQRDKFGSPELAYAAYNAGPGAVQKAGGVPNYPETQNYVRKNMAGQKQQNPFDAVDAAPRAPKNPFDAFDAIERRQPAQQTRYDPTEGMSTADKFWAGVGAGMYGVARGIGQRARDVLPTSLSDKMGLPTQADIDEARRIDAPLMNTTAGQVGNITGAGAVIVPTAFIPGANTLAGAALIGGATGLLQPTATGESMWTNAGMGAVGGAGGVLAGRGLAAAAKGAKALAEPFYDKGREAIVARTMQRFSADPKAAAQAAAAYRSAVPGVNPTLAEATLDPGLAQLQRSALNVDPQAAAALTERQLANNAARVGELGKIAGDDVALAAAKDARESAANALYGKASASDAMRRELATKQAMEQGALDYARSGGMGRIPSPSALAADAVKPSDRLQGLMNRPAFSRAVEEAKSLAANNAENIGDPLTSVRGLHYVKLALDDMLEPNATNALGRNAKRGLTSMKDILVDEIGKISPAYDAARKVYADMSAPVNQMELGRTLLQKASSAAEDKLGNPTLYNEKFAKAIRDSSQTVKAALGRNNARLSDVFTPEQMTTVNNVSKDLSRMANADKLGKASGSNTAQNLASENLMRQSFGPLGLPQSWMEGTILRTLARPAQAVYNAAAEPRVQGLLADVMMDPQRAAALLNRQMTISPAERAALLGGRYTGLLGTVTGLTSNAGQ